MTIISSTCIAHIKKIFCYKHFYGNKFLENKSDILIALFRFRQKGLSEITKPFHLCKWEKGVEPCMKAYFNVGLDSNCQNVSDLQYMSYKISSQNALYRNCTSDGHCLHMHPMMQSNDELLGLPCLPYRIPQISSKAHISTDDFQ
jgi:hypothetical protein